MAQAENVAARLGYSADPGIELLLPKDMLAKIKMQRLEMQINELKLAMENLEMQRDMLAKEYKLKRR